MRVSVTMAWRMRKASRYEISCEYIGQAVADSQKGVVPPAWVCARVQQLLAVKRSLLRNVRRGLGIGRILWNDLGKGNGYEIWKMECYESLQGRLTEGSSK